MHFRTILWSMCALVVVSSAASAAPIASSTFDSNDEGWQLVSTIGYTGSVTYMSTGGNPNGFIYGQDPDTGAFGFSAPSKFLGSVTDAYGQDLTFDIAAYQTPDTSTSWVGMRGTNDLELICYFDTPSTVYPAWHGRSITMTESAGWERVSDGQTPTYAEFMSVLNDLDGLVIMAEFVQGLENDISGIDNVVFMPEPGTLLLFVIAISACTRRKK